jgi:hypothetical protein
MQLSYGTYLIASSALLAVAAFRRTVRYCVASLA